MRLATIRTAGGTRAVRVDEQQAVETGHGDVGELLNNPDWRAAAERASRKEHDLDGLDFAPLILRPQMTLCVGLNYLDHIAESGQDQPKYPTLFPKFPQSLIGANDPIQMPRDEESTRVDWEAELTVVIGSRIRRASADAAADAIAGYTVANDVSVRDYQFRTTQWLQGKIWDATTPVGPYLVTADTDQPPAYPIACRVDGQTMQNSNTRELCFKPVELVQYISTIITLSPGDLILTGTPSGIGNQRDPKIFLRRGQVVETSIDGVGVCRNVCA